MYTVKISDTITSMSLGQEEKIVKRRAELMEENGPDVRDKIRYSFFHPTKGKFETHFTSHTNHLIITTVISCPSLVNCFPLLLIT